MSCPVWELWYHTLAGIRHLIWDNRGDDGLFPHCGNNWAGLHSGGFCAADAESHVLRGLRRALDVYMGQNRKRSLGLGLGQSGSGTFTGPMILGSVRL